MDTPSTRTFLTMALVASGVFIASYGKQMVSVAVVA
jgi:hypothetical protein